MLHEFHKLENKAEKKIGLIKPGEKTEEEREESLWDRWVDVENPNTFGFLELAKDGGFSEVKALYQPSRWISALVLVVFVLYNVYSVIILDTSFVWDREAAAKELETTIEAIDKFYFSESIIKFVAPKLGFETVPASVQVIGILELCGLAFFIGEFLLCCLIAATTQGFRKWHAIYTIFWSTLPTLSVYSAMRLLYNIVPTVFIATANQLVAELMEAKSEKKSLGPHIRAFARWLFAVILGFIVGFDTFLMKLRIVSAAANSSELTITVMLSTVQFLIQVMGVVQLGTFVRQRLFKFIFGGEDGILQDEEIVLMETWQALLAKRIYRETSFLQFIAVMGSFSDEDFQGLVLNENSEVKKRDLGE